MIWEYTIANISDYDLPEVAFGYWVDNAIGDNVAGAGDDDELGFYDTKIDLAYSWDIDGIGQGGYPTGTIGFAYLESPGLAYDGIDNDEDGLIDEKRDNDAGSKIGPTDGISSLSDFLSFYSLTEEDLHEHYEGDEDQDWVDGVDLNDNGVYAVNIGTDVNPVWVTEPGEDAGDDVGLDGVGPTELNYYGPDEGEGNHMPDYIEGFGCEPNFGLNDVSESDMIGLTAFQLFEIQPHVPPYNKWFRNDKSMWELIGTRSVIAPYQWQSNLVETFASGPFPLYMGRTERFSIAELHSFDPLEGLNSDQHLAPALFNLKKSVQTIYENDYRFENIDPVVGVEIPMGIPTEYSLKQNYPNPFNPVTTISYDLPKSSDITLRIYDIIGRLVETLVNQHQIAGNYQVQWNASRYSSGVYFYQIKAGDFHYVKKMLLIK